MSRTDDTMTLTAVIDGTDVRVTVAYAYVPGQKLTHDQEGFDESVELLSCMDGNVEIYAQLTADEIAQIESDILAALKKEAAQEAYAEGAE